MTSVFLGSEVSEFCLQYSFTAAAAELAALFCSDNFCVTSECNSFGKALYLEPPCGDSLHYQSFLTNMVFVIESIFFLLLISANHIGDILGILNPFYMPLGNLTVLLLFSVSLLHLAMKNSECGCSF